MASLARGLYNFIDEIKNAVSGEDERNRVEKELANIRNKFSAPGLNEYQKKKYVWKMCYIYMLGYDVDFGHQKIISLLSSPKISVKSVGYMAVSMLIHPGDPMITHLMGPIRADLIGRDDAACCFSLAAVANIGGTEFADGLAVDVTHLVAMPHDARMELNGGGDARKRAFVVKKACLCLLRLFRASPGCVKLESWPEKFCKMLEDQDIGVITSAMSLLMGFASNEPSTFEGCIPYVTSVLTRLVISRTVPADYLYYKTPSPWLQYFRAPQQSQLEILNECLIKILTKTEMASPKGGLNVLINKSNSDNAVVFEALYLVMSYGDEESEDVKDLVDTLLSRFIAVQDANVRYLALDGLARKARYCGAVDVLHHMGTVLASLRDADISVRHRALDLVFLMACEKNVKEIIDDLLILLITSENDIKEELVVKMAIITEKFSPDRNWYVDIMIQVILAAGDFVAESVWFRIVQVISQSTACQEYACEKLLEAAQNKYAHETTLCLAGYVLGEFGANCCDVAGMSGYDQFAALQAHLHRISPKTKALLLTTFCKFLNLYPELVDLINGELRKCTSSTALELQQRSCEYLKIPTLGTEAMEMVLDNMPAYVNTVNNLEVRLQHKTDNNTADKNVLSVKKGDPKHPSVDNRHQAEASNVDDASALMDLLSVDASSAGSEGRSYDPSLTRDISGWLATSLTALSPQKGMLFDNEIMRISTAVDFRGHQGMMAVFVLNKTKSTIEGLEILCKDEAVYGNGLEVVVVAPLDATKVVLNPNEENRISHLKFSCMKPFAAAVPMKVTFTVHNEKYLYNLTSPCLPSSFYQAAVVEKDVYMQRWKALTPTEDMKGKEVQEVFAGAVPITLEHLQRVKHMGTSVVHLGVTPAIDSDTTLTGCCTVRTGTMQANGTPLVVGVMMRLEADVSSQKYRLTVRSSQPTAALGMCAVWKALLC